MDRRIYTSHVNFYILKLNLMAEKNIFPKTRFDLAKILKSNETDISSAMADLEVFIELDIAQRNSLKSSFWRFRENMRKARKPVDGLAREWWHSELSTIIELKIEQLTHSDLSTSSVIDESLYS